MRFLNALGWLGLLAVPVIVIIYIIKSQYKPKTVSSTFIWKRSLKFVKRKIPLNLIMSLLLILQILVAIAATLAITQPEIETKSDEVIVIVDASASMNTNDGSEKTRFDIAKQKIEEKASGLSVNMSIIYAGEVAEKVSGQDPLTTKEDVLAILDELECTEGNGDINSALTLAEECLNKNKDARVLIYTDKQHPIAESSINTIEIVSCVALGERNTGIVSVTDQFLSSVSGYRFDTYVKNYGAETAFTISMYMHDGVSERFVTSRNVTMKDNEELNIFFTSVENPTLKPGQLHVWIANSFADYEYVRFSINTDDNLVEDNEYKLYAMKKETPSILLVSKNIKLDEHGNIDRNQEPLMKTVIGAFGHVIKNADMHLSIPQDKLSGYDLYIFEGFMPEVLPTDGAVWLFNMPSAPAGVNIQLGLDITANTSGGFRIVESDTIASDEVSLLIKDKVDFSDPIKGESEDGTPVTINAVLQRYTAVMGNLPKGFVPIFSTNNSPIMFVGKIGTVKTIMTTFDFSNSSLPLFLTDFPLLVYNMLQYSLAEPLDERTAFVGETLDFEVPIGAQKIEFFAQGDDEEEKSLLATWDASTQRVDAVPNIVFDRRGTYQIVVNFSNDIENEKLKTYTVTTHIPEKETSIFASGEMLDVTIDPNADSKNSNMDILPWVIGVLIILLIVEWGVYYRNEH